MDTDEPPTEGLPKPDPDSLQLDSRVLKRKKTVTWAEDDELELPLGPPAAAAAGASPEQAAAASPAGGASAAAPPAAVAGAPSPAPTSATAASSEQQLAVVVLPCDSLFDTLSADLLQQQVDAPEDQQQRVAAAAGEPLKRRQLLERRLAHTEQLAALYHREMWALLEELKLRHDQFVAQAQQGTQQQQQAPQQRLSVWKVEGSGAGVEHAAAATQPLPSSSSGNGCSSLRTVWEQWQQEAVEGAAAAAPAAESSRSLGSRPQDVGQAQAANEQEQQQQHPASPLPPVPRFEDVEQLILSGAAAGYAVDAAALLSQRQQFVRQLALLGRLEQSALGATCRELDALGGLALLCSRRNRYVLRRAAVAIGRSSESGGKVDVDLTAEGPGAQRVSRQQAQLTLEPDGAFQLRCTGRRAMLVNGRHLGQGQVVVLPSLSHIRAGDISLLFIANSAAVQRVLQRSTLMAA